VGLQVAGDVDLEGNAPVAHVVAEARILVEPGAVPDAIGMAEIDRLADRLGAGRFPGVHRDRQPALLGEIEGIGGKTPGGNKPAAQAPEAPAAEAAATPAQASPQQRAPLDLTQLKVEKSCSRGLATWLSSNRVSLAISSYQTGRVYLVGSDQQGRVSFFERIFERAMGIVGNAQRIYLGGLYQLWRFENVLRPNEVIHGQFDKCYVPRNAQTIGDLDIHELGIRKNGKVVFINTKYSCLAELSMTHSFKVIWKPDFISKLAPEDRCHLNGLAMVDGEPKYVTAVCKSDAVDGWRDRRRDGGVVIDIDSNEIVCEGLSMPHSERSYSSPFASSGVLRPQQRMNSSCGTGIRYLG
jgi:hypothetical protein